MRQPLFAFLGLRCGVPPRQTHEINAVRWSQVADCKNSPNRGIRRGRPLTSQTAFGGSSPIKGALCGPLRDFIASHSSIMAGFYEPRTTNHEPRFFSRAEGYSRRCRRSEFVAAQRHLNPRRPANCDRRGRQAPKFDERLFARPIGPNLH